MVFNDKCPKCGSDNFFEQWVNQEWPTPECMLYFTRYFCEDCAHGFTTVEEFRLNGQIEIKE